MEQPVDLSELDFNIPDQSPINDASKTPKRQELFVMTIEIENHQQVTLTVHSDDDPFILAKSFSKKYSLDLNFQQSLEKIIKSNKDMIENRAASASPDMAVLADFLSTPAKSPISFQLDKRYTPKIDKKSIEIARRLTKENVYDRLYRQKRSPVQSPSPGTVNKTRLSSINHGEWLYVNGLRKKEQFKKTAQQIKNQQEEEKNIESTFKPQINRCSTLLIPRYYERTEDLLIQKAKDYQMKLDELKESKLKEELKECSFTPKIIETSGTRNRILEKDYLYKEAEKKRARSKSNSERSINSPKVGTRNTSNDKESVFNRLYNLNFKIKAEMEHIRKKSDIQNPEFFHPQIGNTAKEREDSSTPIWEHLYSQRDKLSKMIEETNEQTQEFWKATAAAQKSCEASQAIYKNFKNKNYEKLFKSLDSDEDGYISYESIDKEEFDPKILQILSPFFAYLEESRETLNFQQFIEKLENFMKSMNVEEKAQIFKRNLKVEPEGRKSLISVGSEKIISRKKTTGLYERLLTSSKMKEDKIQRLKEKKINDEMKQCTFKPVLNL